jgi:hypothetical protein
VKSNSACVVYWHSLAHSFSLGWLLEADMGLYYELLLLSDSYLSGKLSVREYRVKVGMLMTEDRPGSEWLTLAMNTSPQAYETRRHHRGIR